MGEREDRSVRAACSKQRKFRPFFFLGEAGVIRGWWVGFFGGLVCVRGMNSVVAEKLQQLFGGDD